MAAPPDVPLPESQPDKRSPLEEYFRDADRELLPSPSHRAWGGKSDAGDSVGSADTASPCPRILLVRSRADRDVKTLVNMLEPYNINKLSPEAGWTGVLPNSAGPSRPSRLQTRSSHTIPSPPLQPPGRYPDVVGAGSAVDEDAVFAERFKYLVCSSGLLEKDWVPGLGGEDGQVAQTTLGPTEVSSYHLAESAPLWTCRLPDGAVAKMDRARNWAITHWDVCIAGVVLLFALAIVLNTVRIIMMVVAVSAGIGWLLHHISPRTPNSDPCVQDPSAPSSTLSEAPQSQALSALATLLAISRQFDTTLQSSLSLLAPYPSSLSAHRELRTAVHRLCNGMTDHLASATSSLLELVDKEELAVLGEMYDIPVAGSFFYTRRLPQPMDEDERSNISAVGVTSGRSDDDSGVTSFIPSKISSTATPRRTTQPFDFRASPPRALAMAHSSTMPGRIGHTVHLSLTPSRPFHRSPYSAGSIDDRFTAVPERTPRLSKRASWDHEAWQAARNEGLGGKWAEKKVNSSKRPSHPRRITEADEEDEADRSSSGESLGGSISRVDTPNVPTTPSMSGASWQAIKSTFTPQRASPLARRPSQSENAVAPMSTQRTPLRPLSAQGHLPSLFARDLNMSRSLSAVPASANPKRRSLQNIHYYPSSDDDALGASIARTKSMLQSDLQTLRTRHATGGTRSASQSIHSVFPAPIPRSPLGAARTFPPQTRRSPLLSPIPRPRVTSLSPLTLPALQAACLGVHLKRRRMVCCLLGLKFGSDGGAGYWEDVRSILDDLHRAMESERRTLEDALRQEENGEVGQSVRSRRPDDILLPPWAGVSTGVLSGGKDFAPRTSDQQRLDELLGDIQAALTRSWEETVGLRDEIAGGAEVGDAWTRLREGFGIMIRDWDRGREVVTRLASGGVGQLTHADHMEGGDRPARSPTSPEVALPDFLRAWDDDIASTRSTSIETTGATDAGAAWDEQGPLREVEALPLPGADEVFEATLSGIPPRNPVLAGMTREERIRLTKEARSKGVTLSELLEGERGISGQDLQDRDMRAAGGMVVDELKGMIGIIRQRKGQMSPEKKRDLEQTQRVTDGEKGAEAADQGRRTRCAGSNEGDVAGLDRSLLGEELKRSFTFPRSQPDA